MTGWPSLRVLRVFARKRRDFLVGNAAKAGEFLDSTLDKTAISTYYTSNRRIHKNVAVRDFLLAEGMPATTLPMGLEKLDIRHAGFIPDDNNFDMPEKFIEDKKAWPVKELIKGNSNKKTSVWHHSAFSEVPYQHTRALYKKFVELMEK